MKVAVYSTRTYDRHHLSAADSARAHEFVWIEPLLTVETASLARGCEAVCAFVNDHLDATVLARLSEGGTRLIALRCAGYNNVDLAAAASLGLTVTHVPSYSPHAVAEHAIALLLTLNRRTHLAYNRVKRGDFSIDGLTGFDLTGKTAALLGTGRIGTITGKILQGFGCHVLAHDPFPPPEALGASFEFVGLDDLLTRADVISLHCPLLPSTRYIINAQTLSRIRPHALLINTSRGGLIDTAAAIDALENNRIGGLGLDVYEHEAELFFEDHSASGLTDPLLARLLALPNVVLTGHQAFLTQEALNAISASVLESINALAAGRTCRFALKPKI